MTVLNAGDSALVRTIFSPPRARRPWSLGDVLPPGVTTYYSLGRWALVEALRMHGIGPGDRVLIPALICRDVLAAISQVGATADFYPVSRQLCPATLEPAAGTRAVLAVNYFGFPQDLRPFRELCARTGAALIEDNAHGLFSRDRHGAWLGGRADAGIFSFRKTIAVPDGGALVVGPGAPPAERVTPARRLAIRYHAKQAIRRVAGRVDPVRTIGAIAAVQRVRRSLHAEAPPSHRDAETRIPHAASPPATIMNRIAVADPELESQRRRALYRLSRQILDSAGVGTVFPDLPEHVAPYGCPLLAPAGDVAAIAAHLARHGMPLVPWPDLPTAIASSAPDHYRQLMVVPFLW